MEPQRAWNSIPILFQLGLGIFLILANTSCGSDQRVPDALRTEFDTVNSVAIALNHGEPPLWPLDTVLSLGGVFATEEQQQFGRINSVVADADGNLFVLDAIRDEVLVFSPDGEYLRMVGRQGPGPGEYKNPDYLGLLGDTLLVSDGTDLRVDLFELDGEWIDEWRIITNLGGIIQTGLEQIWLSTLRLDGSAYQQVFADPGTPAPDLLSSQTPES